MFKTKSHVISGANPAVFPAGSEVVAQRAQITATAADVAVGSVGALLILPADCVPVGVHLDADAPIEVSVGIVDQYESDVSTEPDDGGAAWVSALAANGSGFVYSKTMARVRPVQSDRKVGIKVSTAGAAGEVGMTLLYRAA